MIKIQRIQTSHEHYPFVEALMQAAFPPQERRDADLQREYTDRKTCFHCHVLLEKDTPIGLLTLWKLEDFHYIEHFAIHEQYRNKGYGQQVLSLIKEEIKGMIVLEAEEPTDDITRRRIGFYQRQGFVLQETPYLQPPYRKNDRWFPMKLMTLNAEDFNSQFKRVRDTIYQEVYAIRIDEKKDNYPKNNP